MAKDSGLGWTTFTIQDAALSALDVRPDINNFDFSTPRATQDVTGIDGSAFARLLLLADFQVNLSGNWDSSANLFAALRTVPSTDVPRQVVIGLLDVNANTNTLTNTCIFTSFDWTRANTGGLSVTSTGVLSNGVAPVWVTT